VSRQASEYHNYQERAQEFYPGCIVQIIGGHPTDVGRVTQVWTGIGMVDVEFPNGSDRWPVEDLQIVRNEDSKFNPPNNENVPGGAGTVVVPDGPPPEAETEAKRYAASTLGKGKIKGGDNVATSDHADWIVERANDKFVMAYRRGTNSKHARVKFTWDGSGYTAARGQYKGQTLLKKATRTQRVASVFIKQSLYWHARDRKYRCTRSEYDSGKYTCPKGADHGHLAPTVYKRQDGQSVRLLGCRTCLFLIKESDIIRDHCEPVEVLASGARVRSTWKRAAEKWICFTEDNDGHMLNFWGPTSRANCTRILNKEEKDRHFDDNFGGHHTTQADYARERTFYGRKINDRWFSKLPRPDKERLQAFLSGRTANAAADYDADLAPSRKLRPGDQLEVHGVPLVDDLVDGALWEVTGHDDLNYSLQAIDGAGYLQSDKTTVPILALDPTINDSGESYVEIFNRRLASDARALDAAWAKLARDLPEPYINVLQDIADRQPSGVRRKKGKMIRALLKDGLIEEATATGFQGTWVITRKGRDALRNGTDKTADKFKTMPKGWTEESRKKFWESLTGRAPKHKVSACIRKMEGNVDDPGAFCASLADRVLGRTDWRGED